MNSSKSHDAVETKFFHDHFSKLYCIFKPLFTRLEVFPHHLMLYYTFPHIGCAIEPLVEEMFLVLPIVSECMEMEM